MQKKVAILVTKIGDVHREIIKSFRDRLFDYEIAQHCVIEVIEVHSADPLIIERSVYGIIADEFDLIVPIGSRCAVATKKVVSKRRYKTPILFLCVCYPIEDGLIDSFESKDSYITGMVSIPPSNVIPIQLVVKMLPHIDHFVIPYRVGGVNERTDFNAWEMKNYLRSLSRSVSLVPITSENDVETSLDNVMKQGSVIAIPVASMFPCDVSALSRVKEKFDAILLGEGSGKIPHAALFGYKDDIVFMGAKGAEYANKHLFEGVNLRDLPVYQVKTKRLIHFNEDQMAAHGLSCAYAEDILSSIDQAAERCHLPFHYYAVVDYYSAMFGKLFMHGLVQESEKHEADATYGFRHMEGNYYDMDQRNRHILEAMNGAFGSIITLSEEARNTAIRKMVTEKKYFPLLSMLTGSAAYLESQKEALSVLPKEVARASIHLEEYNPLLPLQLLDLINMFRATGPDKLQSVGLVYSADTENVPPRLQSYISCIETYLKAQGRKLIHDGAWNNDAALEKAKAIIAQTDATFLLEDFVRQDLAVNFGPFAHEQGHLVCGVSLPKSDSFPLSYGLQYQSIGMQVFPILNALLHGKQPPQGLLEIAAADAYQPAINAGLCSQLGIEIPDGLGALLAQGVSVDNAIHHFFHTTTEKVMQ
jgi:ABC-type uncharacterized transport system substrate-binding protein